MIASTQCFRTHRVLLALVVTRGRGEAAKDVELLVLRRQVARPRLEAKDRVVLARMPQRDLVRVPIVTPVTLLRWHRQLVTRHWAFPSKPKPKPVGGRPRTAAGIRALVIRLAGETPLWGASPDPRGAGRVGLSSRTGHGLEHPAAGGI